MDEIRVIACNYRLGTSECARGALAFVVLTNPGNGHDKIMLAARSRGGRFIEKYEAIHRLHNFRFKTMIDRHALYTRLNSGFPYTQADIDSLRAAQERETARREARCIKPQAYRPGWMDTAHNEVRGLLNSIEWGAK